MEEIRIAIVDDQNIFRESLSLLIHSVPGFRLIAEAADGFELLDLLSRLSELPHVLLMDMNLPGMNGVELHAQLKTLYPKIRVIVLSVHTQDKLITKMTAEGVAGYLAKNCDKKELTLAIKSTYETGFYINAQVLRAMQETSKRRNKTFNHLNSPPADLSERELQVLQLICKEQSSAEIAEQLFLSIRTVEGHRNNLLLKTQSRNTAGLVLFAIRHQLFEVL